MIHTEKELQILENIHKNASAVRQRDLAAIAGLSLGMTNAILNRLAKKGWITIRKVNNRNIRYAVTPKGMEVLTRKSYQYFKRTIKNVVYYREAIEELVGQAHSDGYGGLVLVGNSDLDFIVEHACRRAGVDYLRDTTTFDGKIFYLYSESYIPDEEEERNRKDVLFLQKVFVG